MESTSTLLQLKSIIDSGSSILWVGSISSKEVLVRLTKDGVDTFTRVCIDTIPKVQKPYIVEHNEATEGVKKFVGVTWQRSGWLRSLRVASIYGINIASKCNAGLGNLPTELPATCIMGYDIETSQHLVKQGGFPPSYSRITSIALWCTCGYCKAWTTIEHRPVDGITYCISSRQLVGLSIEGIEKHMPQWLVGYNCYQFDNCALAYHCPPNKIHMFRSINTGAKSASRYAFYLDIKGVNNVDLYSYLDKCLRRTYSALGLGTVAQYHGLGGKTQMPTTDSEDTVYQLIEYNINDSMLTAQLWTATGVNEQILGLCSAACSPVIDCVRYVSGTMASCAVSSYCISNGMIMDWSECNLRIGYEGGTVLNPIRSVFRSVVVVDFSAMYPTIIKDIGISPENITILGNCSKMHQDKIVWWNSKCTIMCIKGKIIKYDKESMCMTRDVLEFVTTLRGKYKKTNPSYANGLKVLANSLYGALGFASSPLHSPRAAATVTVVGRTALALAYTMFTGLGLTVVYGDTDSCFLASGPGTSRYFNNSIEAHIDFALNIFHKTLQYTPIPSMRMEKEDMFKSVLLVDKKHYAYATLSGDIKTKGLSTTRKDRIGICRDMTSMVAQQILLQDNIEVARENICNMLSMCYSSTIQGALDMYSISREVRYEGTSCYRFTDKLGNDIHIPVTRADKTTSIPYDVDKVLKSLETDMNRICLPAGLGDVSSMLTDSSILF